MHLSQFLTSTRFPVRLHVLAQRRVDAALVALAGVFEGVDSESSAGVHLDILENQS